MARQTRPRYEAPALTYVQGVTDARDELRERIARREPYFEVVSIMERTSRALSRAVEPSERDRGYIEAVETIRRLQRAGKEPEHIDSQLAGMLPATPEAVSPGEPGDEPTIIEPETTE